MMTTNLTLGKVEGHLSLQGKGRAVYINRGWTPRSIRSANAPLLAKRRVTVLSSRMSAGSHQKGPKSRRQDVSKPSEAAMLEYDWPDLPPVEQIKDALSRTRVSQGVSYILPMDKSKNGVENVYRTDLRFLFRDPYHQHAQHFHEEKVLEGTRHHFVINSPTRRFMVSPDDYTQYTLNAESDQVRKNYLISAPPKGIVGKHTTPNSKELQTRSNLYLPMKIKSSTNDQGVRQEARKIYQSIAEKHETESLEKDREGEPPSSQQYPEEGSTGHPDGQNERRPFQKKASVFRSYEELKNASHPDKPQLPENLKSPFLTEEKNQEIWSWLIQDEVITDFKHFLSVCS